jgi:hypothetical protein
MESIGVKQSTFDHRSPGPSPHQPSSSRNGSRNAPSSLNTRRIDSDTGCYVELISPAAATLKSARSILWAGLANTGNNYTFQLLG